MQCVHKNHIYVINKRLLAQDLVKLSYAGLINYKNLCSIWGGNNANIADKMTKSKEWVFFNRCPRDSKSRLIRELYNRGYFDFFEVGCQKCEICKTQKSKQWTNKAECEGRCWKNKTFITLTYNPENLPKDRKLHRPDIQKFWKQKWPIL